MGLRDDYHAYPTSGYAAARPSSHPHNPANPRGWLPKLFDHTPPSDFIQSNHLSLSYVARLVTNTHGGDPLFRFVSEAATDYNLVLMCGLIRWVISA
jgi:hypothetical protein